MAPGGQQRADSAWQCRLRPAVASAPALSDRKCTLDSGRRWRCVMRAARSRIAPMPRQGGFRAAKRGSGGSGHKIDLSPGRPAPARPSRPPTGVPKVSHGVADIVADGAAWPVSSIDVLIRKQFRCRCASSPARSRGRSCGGGRHTRATRVDSYRRRAFRFYGLLDRSPSACGSSAIDPVALYSSQ